METTLARTAAAEMTCPACRARQTWSDECRRCKCDLSLLHAVYDRGEVARRSCLRAVNEGRYEDALGHAQLHAELNGGQRAIHLLAVCHLICEDWEEARQLGLLETE